MNIEADDEIGAEEVISLRMVDYVQSVIAAVQPAETQKARNSVTDKEWKVLRSKVEHLFNEIRTTYQICRTAKDRADDPNLDMNFEEFHLKAQLYWCNVRGQRYPVHQTAYLKEMFLPHTDILQKLFGISGEQFISEINKIWHVLSFGTQDLLDNIEQLRRDTSAIDKKVDSLSSNHESNPLNLTAETIKENGWEERRDDTFERIQGMKFFDIQEITILPEKLLKELSWLPGEDKDFFAKGEFCGWPLRIWPIFKRPFIQLGGRYYCFDLSSLFDNLYRVMQRIILRIEPDYKKTWNTIQRSQSEDLPFKRLEHLLPGAKVLREVYYRGKTDKGGNDWCEADGLLIYDDHLFIVEARGGAFTYTPPATDFQAYIESLKNLVLKPAMQGRRFLNYLNSAESVPLFDSNHNQTNELHKSDFRHITICAVTVDPFIEHAAAQIQHLRKIGVNVGVEPVWAISLDDLRVYADIFENPLIFLHYIEQRMQAFRSDIVQCDDEFDHLGLYLNHNHYSTYLKELQGTSNARISLFGYRSEIDKFFHERLLDSNTPCPLKQDTSARLLDIVEFLSRSDKSGRAEIAAYLLNLSGTWRTNFDTSIHEELVRQPVTKRSLPFSVYGDDFNLTVFCWTEYSGPRSTFSALYHARKLVVMHNEGRRLLIELSYAVTGELQDVNWTWVELAGIPSSELPKLRSEANNLRQKRIAQAKTQNRKVGRNAPCPCGSGKKYKKCCLGRNSH